MTICPEMTSSTNTQSLLKMCDIYLKFAFLNRRKRVFELFGKVTTLNSPGFVFTKDALYLH